MGKLTIWATVIVTIAVAALVGLGGTLKSADAASVKNYCAWQKEDYATTNGDVQYFLDYAIVASGGVFVIEYDDASGIYFVNEPDDSFAQVMSSDDDFVYPFDPGAEYNPLFIPVVGASCSVFAPHVAVCDKNGSFRDVELASWNDPIGEWYHLPFAKFASGGPEHGLTCDNLAGLGYTDANTLVDSAGNQDPNSDPNAAAGSGNNRIYELWVSP